ncbi:MAG: hypothetical protein M1832_001272 [Thelocarpon impressellum]|nr:MAG: hypothetical protein M1832_001272 [Thelocarpon impressellum]
MPVKWTSDNDQMLLLKLLESNPNISIDAQAISAAWPSDRERPSPRAITERFVRIRQLAKIAGVGHFKVSSATSTPKKARGGATAGGAWISPRGVTGGVKRKRGGEAAVKQQEEVAAPPPPIAVKQKVVIIDDDEDEDDALLDAGAAYSNGHAATADLTTDLYSSTPHPTAECFREVNTHPSTRNAEDVQDDEGFYSMPSSAVKAKQQHRSYDEEEDEDDDEDEDDRGLVYGAGVPVAMEYYDGEEDDDAM